MYVADEVQPWLEMAGKTCLHGMMEWWMDEANQTNQVSPLFRPISLHGMMDGWMGDIVAKSCQNMVGPGWLDVAGYPCLNLADNKWT